MTIYFRFFCTILLSSTFAAIAHASEGALNNAWDDFKSPVTTNAKYIFYGGSALAIALAILEDSISDPLQQEAIENRPLGNFASDLGQIGGTLAPNIAYALSMYGYSLLADDSSALDRSNMMARATLYAQGITTALKQIVREPRPDGSERVSFPSGHSTGAFAFASVIGAEHEWYWGTLAYSYASLVAYSRMNDNRHFLHDVIAGATIGASYGLGLYYRSHSARETSRTDADQRHYFVQVYPTESLDGACGIFTVAF